MIPPVASNFIAGESEKEALDRTKYLNQYSITPIYNNLGEHYESKRKVEDCISNYKKLIDSFDKNVNAELSIKPTQIGLDIGNEYFKEKLIKILDYADKNNVFVWIDMEKPKTIDKTLDSYRKRVQFYNNECGICLQANMRRTNEDIKSLSGIDNASVRLVKGAYPGNATISDETDINKRYKSLVNLASKNIDGRIAIGSHDEEILTYAMKSDIDNLEFQMLRGVKEEKQIQLSRNYKVCQYVPYGSEWISYTYRRIKERPKNILLIGKSIKNKFL